MVEKRLASGTISPQTRIRAWCKERRCRTLTVQPASFIALLESIPPWLERSTSEHDEFSSSSCVSTQENNQRGPSLEYRNKLLRKSGEAAELVCWLEGGKVINF